MVPSSHQEPGSSAASKASSSPATRAAPGFQNRNPLRCASVPRRRCQPAVGGGLARGLSDPRIENLPLLQKQWPGPGFPSGLMPAPGPPGAGGGQWHLRGKCRAPVRAWRMERVARGASPHLCADCLAGHAAKALPTRALGPGRVEGTVPEAEGGRHDVIPSPSPSWVPAPCGTHTSTGTDRPLALHPQRPRGTTLRAWPSRQGGRCPSGTPRALNSPAAFTSG